MDISHKSHLLHLGIVLEEELKRNDRIRTNKQVIICVAIGGQNDAQSCMEDHG